MAPKLGANGMRGGSTEPLGQPNQPKAHSPPPLAGGPSGWALVEAHESWVVLAPNISIYGPSLMGRMGRCADAVFVFTFGPIPPLLSEIA